LEFGHEIGPAARRIDVEEFQRNLMMQGTGGKEDYEDYVTYAAKKDTDKVADEVSDEYTKYFPEDKTQIPPGLDEVLDLDNKTESITALNKYKKENGICELCHKLIGDGVNWRQALYHHRKLVSDGGEGSSENCMLLHPMCHKEKFFELHGFSYQKLNNYKSYFIANFFVFFHIFHHIFRSIRSDIVLIFLFSAAHFENYLPACFLI
jgi:hypothetical protein